MGSKVNVLPIVSGHFATLRDFRTGKISALDLLTQIGIPCAVGVVAWLVDLKFAGVYANIIAALAIVFGFAFAVTVFVFQLRMQMAEMQISSESQDRVAEIAPQIDTRAPTLVNELFANCLYATLLSGVATLLACSIEPLAWQRPGDWALTAVIAHLILVLMMCFKRLNSAFLKVSDFTRLNRR
ncbi:hypothetical protein [Sinomonas humi]|uniref:Uncharacterized protein n=1 Tax=Sinomonas humi TaxID=1338436 RepID=A0A0B2AMM7_9MICC|nr:hypothetical protein [Sinomonas humi]KHL03151.1 hypothetical protein LK10_10320 [Sinomonas humi]